MSNVSGQLLRLFSTSMVISMAITSVSFLSSHEAHAEKGGMDSGGGSVYEAEFKWIGQSLLKSMKRARLTSADLGFEMINFEVALSEVEVFGTDQALKLNDHDKTAINSLHQKVIVFNNAIWAKLNSNQKELLVLHEYFRFVGVDDSRYAYSTRIIDLLSKQPDGIPAPPDFSPSAQMYKIIGVEDHFISGSSLTLANNQGIVNAYCSGINNGYSREKVLYLTFHLKSGKEFQVKKRFAPKEESKEKCNRLYMYITNSTLERPVTVVVDFESAVENPDKLITIF